MSLGIDVIWRRRAIVRLATVCGPPPGQGRIQILDLATGTADLAIGLARRFPDAEVDGVDLTPAMLEIGAKKVEKAGMSTRIRLREGDAANLEFADSSFDMATCAFGFRNFPDREHALSEVARVLKPQGYLLVLELLRRDRSIFAWFTSVWLKLVSWIFVQRNKRGNYEYLRRSIAAAPSAEEFSKLAETAGLKLVARKFFLPSCTCLLFRNMKGCSWENQETFV